MKHTILLHWIFRTNLLHMRCILCLGAIFLSACAPPRPPASTETMVAHLERIADETEANPIRNVHVNKARVARLLQVPLPTDPQQRISYWGQLGQEQLHAGHNRDAIDTFTRILDFVEGESQLGSPESVLAVKDYLAISYMRLAEEENCIDNHSIDRCLWPIREGGVHTRKLGSRRAIGLYTEILNEAPGDLDAIWLMNVAYQTLGLYPDSVPAAWLIPPESMESDYNIQRFPDVAMRLGVDVVGLSGGVVMDDFNGDGNLDIFASSWGLRDTLALFLNGGKGEYVSHPVPSGITGGLNLVHADYDNDGDVDVFVLRGAWLGEGHPNSLLRNQGDGTFEDVTEASGLFSLHPTQTAAWGDFNNDGWIDLFVGNETSQQGWPHPSELFRNNGDGTFTDVAAAAGLRIMRYVKGVVWGDYDNDGLPDLYVSNWQAPNMLFHNLGPDEDGAWRFSDVAAEAGVVEPVVSFPTWFWDYDNDGWQDLFVSGWKARAGDMAAELLGRPVSAELPKLYRNRGDGRFEDVTEQVRLNKVMYTMGSNFGDLDNDGYLDFYVGTGDPDYRSLMPNRMFRNAAGESFQEVTQSGGFGHLQKGHGVAFGDADNDGDQDIYAVIGGAYDGDVFGNAFFQNPGHGNRWITLLLEGRESNRSAIGARVAVSILEEGQRRVIHRTAGSGGSFGASSLRQEIGLGRAESIEYIEVFWPASGQRQRLENLEMDTVYKIIEEEGIFECRMPNVECRMAS